MRTHTASTVRDMSAHDDVLSVSTPADGEPATKTPPTTSAGAPTMDALDDAPQHQLDGGRSAVMVPADAGADPGVRVA